MTGASDGYDNDPDAGPKLVASLTPADRAKIRTEVMANAHHGFDMPGICSPGSGPRRQSRPGGLVTMAYNAEAAERLHALAVAFFSETMAGPSD